MTNDEPSTNNTTNSSASGASPDTTMEFTSMDLRQLHSSQQEAMKKIIEFSGEPNESDIDEWLYDLTNLFTVMKLKDETRIIITMGKLIGPALRWYQANLTSFDSWKSAEDALRNRFKTFTSDSQLMQEFFQLHQEEYQSITSFYENVIQKYKRSKGLITEQQAITVLQTGVKQTLKEHLIRNEQDITKLDDWLELAKEEEHIQKRIQQQRNGFYSEATTEPFFDSMVSTATIQPKPSNTQIPRPIIPKQSNFDPTRRQQRHKFEQTRTFKPFNNHRDDQHKQEPYSYWKTQQADSCLICHRKNHPTSKCYYKKEQGCFKCGQSNHRLRDCPQQHFFD